MDSTFRAVLELYRRRHPDLIGDRPAVPSFQLEESRRQLIKRTAGELERALLNDDLPAIAAELVILIRVLVGTAIVYGIALPEIDAAIPMEKPVSLPGLAERLAKQAPISSLVEK